jgi:hypothetical protein
MSYPRSLRPYCCKAEILQIGWRKVIPFLGIYHNQETLIVTTRVGAGTLFTSCYAQDSPLPTHSNYLTQNVDKAENPIVKQNSD